MPEVQDTPYVVACADLMQVTTDAVAVIATQHNVPPLALLLNLTEQLIAGLESLDPDATLTLLEAWSNLIVINNGDEDEADLICQTSLRREVDDAVRILRQANARQEAAA